MPKDGVATTSRAQSTDLTKPTLDPLPYADAEIKRLREELAKATAELERIRKRLAQPPPGHP
jgi:molecular chaperone GrpE (heat shock protein)